MKRPQPRASRLEEARLAICEKSAIESDRLGYYPSVMANLCLPASKHEGSEYLHEVGPYRLSVVAPSEFGVPYGAYPRVILSKITTEVILNKRRQLEDPRNITLGSSVTAALEHISGKRHASGGPKSPRAKLEQQMLSLANATIHYRYRTQREICGVNMGFSTRYKYREMWRPELVGGRHSTKPKELTLRLNEDFYADLVEHAVPIDDRVLKYLWPRCLEMDIYIWLTYRAARWQGNVQRLKWLDVVRQFGGGYAKGSIRRFKQRFREAFAVVQQVYDPADPSCIRLEEVGEHDIYLTVKRPSVMTVEPTFNKRSFSAPKYSERIGGIARKGKGAVIGQHSLALEAVSDGGVTSTNVSSAEPTPAQIAAILALYPRPEVAVARSLGAIRTAILELVEGRRLPAKTVEEAVEFLSVRTRSFAASAAGQKGEFTPHAANWFGGLRYFDDDSEWNRGTVATVETPVRRRSAVERLQAQGATMRGVA